MSRSGIIKPEVIKVLVFLTYIFLYLQSVEGVYDAFYKIDYCNKVTNLLSQFDIIVGLLPLEGNAVYSTKSHRATVVGSSIINNLTTLYIGTDNGSVIQVTLNHPAFQQFNIFNNPYNTLNVALAHYKK